MHKQQLNKEGWLSSNITICSNALVVMKEHNDYLEKGNRKHTDIDHVIQYADNVIEISIVLK